MRRIVGCGFAGLFAAKALRRAPVEVVVVDRTNHHLFQALLYQVATGVLSGGDIAPPIRDVLRHQRNTKGCARRSRRRRRRGPAS
jgi:NADH:ubiquinone reductase (H+-translocating)